MKSKTQLRNQIFLFHLFSLMALIPSHATSTDFFFCFITCICYVYVYTYMFACSKCGHAHTTAHMWKSEDRFRKPVASCYVGPRDRIQDVRCNSKHLDPVSHLASQHLDLLLVYFSHPTKLSAASSSLFFWFCKEQNQCSR